MNLTRSLHRFAAIACASTGLVLAADPTTFKGLQEGFENPPQEARPWTLWQWMNGNVSKEGITADLEAFKKAGLGGAQSFHLDYGLPQGPVEFMSPEWLEMYLHAAKEADRLGIEIGTHNGGGWSSSGGPWNKPEHGMQVVTATEVRFKGPGKFDQVLPQPPSYLPADVKNAYRDIAVLAYPAPANEQVSMGEASPKVTITEGKGSKAPTLTGDLFTSFALPVPTVDAPGQVVIEFPEPFTARQIILSPEEKGPGFVGILEVSDDGVTYQKVRDLEVWDQPHRQHYIYRQAFPFPSTTGKFFRITINRAKLAGKPVLIAEAGLSGRETIDNLPGKALYQRHSIMSKPKKAGPGKEDGAIAQGDIVNLTDKVDAEGRLVWDVPAGEWTIVRIGYQPNGAKNHPAPLGGEGLECDKLSREAVDAHWAGMLGKMVEKFGPLTGKSFTKVEIDSWEVGTQNWTPKFAGEFQKRRGYDITPFLPVFAGQVVDSKEATERFLWDFRRTIADLFAENYAARLRELSNQHGMKLAVENYGTGPFDDLQYGGMVDIPMGVHWMHNGSPQGCTLMAASAAHTYGHKIIASEAFTAGELAGNRWETHPYSFKRLGDLIFCAGVNKMIFHAGVLQRFPNLKPGLTFGKVGTQFSRTVTWWDNAGVAWFLYLARAQWLLQQGLPVADVLVLAGENAPSPTYGGSSFPDVPKGYDFDMCSTDAFLNRLSFKDGRFVMPDGMSYRVLMLPSETTMTLPVLRKLKQMAEAGATIVGPKPTTSPSYTGYPGNDQEVQQIAGQLWKPELGPDGRGVSNQTVQTAVTALKLGPDFEATGGRPQILFKHRTTPEAEIYFVSNQKYFTDEIEASFRISGKVPEIWKPDTGEIEKAPLYREENGRTVVPLRLDPSGSVFVVFRNPSGDHLVAEKSVPQAAPQSLKILKANYGTFDPKGNPRVADITSTKASGIKRIMTPERFAKGDPAPGAKKHMLVQYDMNGAIWSQAAPADSVLELPQLPDRFKTTRVLYGELNANPGPKDEVVDVTAKLNDLVKDGALSVKVGPELGGSASGSKEKELRVEYSYNGQWNVAYIPEGSPLELPGAYEAEATAPTHELATADDGRIELRAWVPGTYEFTAANGKTLGAQVKSVPPAQEVKGPWQVSFPPNLGAPAEVTFDRLMSWTESSEAGVKYFSGTATYTKEIEIPADLARKDVELYLDLGEVKDIAQVFLNGKDLGVLWKPPFRVDITKAAQSGQNKLEVKVTNMWPNRLIGDENLPPDRKWTSTRNLEEFPQWLIEGKPSPTGQVAFVTARHWTKDDVLLPSGLLGPVKLEAAEKRILAELK